MAWTIGKSIESYIIVVYMVILKFNLYVWYCVRKTFVRDITKARLFDSSTSYAAGVLELA
jgi:hypothetical protein